MNSNKKFIPVMLMPFNENLSIDYKALDKLIDLYISSGAGGLFANCLSSEMFQLSKSEIIESLSFIIEKVDGKFPIVATGTIQGSIQEQALFIKQVHSVGVDCVIVITSLLAKEDETDDIFESNVNLLLSLTENIPLGFYECPIPYKRIINPKFLGELVATGRIKYHKDTSLDITNITEKVMRTKFDIGFGIYDAYIVHAVDSLTVGSKGLSCIQGNYFPELIVWLCNNYSKEILKDKVSLVQRFLIENMEIMHYAYPASAKYYLKLSYPWINTFCRRTDIDVLDANTKGNLKKLKINYEKLLKIINNN